MTSPRDAAGSSATGQFENGEHHTKKRASRAVDTALGFPFAPFLQWFRDEKIAGHKIVSVQREDGMKVTQFWSR
jgi:hypothetical protein